ncbi:hypothetical protein [Candidatus Nitrososphaera evergladensis]|nr:hypothetical protein [Candidatus Nitrososphaera evergladensis]
MPIIITPSVYAQSAPYPIEIESVRLMDPSGHPLNDCRSGEGLVMIAVTLRNLSNSVQPAAIIVDLQDNSNGISQFVQWQTMSINSNDVQQMALSFDPSSLPSSSTVQYDAKVFVWDKVLTPVPLADPLKVPISCK